MLIPINFNKKVLIALIMLVFVMTSLSIFSKSAYLIVEDEGSNYIKGYLKFDIYAEKPNIVKLSFLEGSYKQRYIKEVVESCKVGSYIIYYKGLNGNAQKVRKYVEVPCNIDLKYRMLSDGRSRYYGDISFSIPSQNYDYYEFDYSQKIYVEIKFKDLDSEKVTDSKIENSLSLFSYLKYIMTYVKVVMDAIF